MNREKKLELWWRKGEGERFPGIGEEEEEEEEGVVFTPEVVGELLKECKNGRTLPNGRMVKEAYQPLVGREEVEGMSLTDAGVTLAMLMEWSGMEEKGARGEWQVSEAVQLDKMNGKEGTKAIRLTNLLDVIGKLLLKNIWRRGKKEKNDFAYGFHRRRRREQAIGVQSVCAWKLRKRRKGHTATLRDASKAVPSPRFESMDRMVDRALRRKDARIMKLRYKRSKMIIRHATGGGVVIEPGCGGMHGDSAMAEMFTQMYEPKVEEWIREKEEEGIGLKAMDPITGEMVQVSATVFFDDVKELNTTDDVEALEEKVQKSTAIFDRKFGDMGMAQNIDKAENASKFCGKGEGRQREEAMKEWRRGEGKDS